MNNSEAIKILNYSIEELEDNEFLTKKGKQQYKEAYELAIAALKLQM